MAGTIVSGITNLFNSCIDFLYEINEIKHLERIANELWNGNSNKFTSEEIIRALKSDYNNSLTIQWRGPQLVHRLEEKKKEEVLLLLATEDNNVLYDDIVYGLERECQRATQSQVPIFRFCKDEFIDKSEVTDVLNMIEKIDMASEMYFEDEENMDSME